MALTLTVSMHRACHTLVEMIRYDRVPYYAKVFVCAVFKYIYSMSV